MKRFFALFLCAVMLLTMFGCAKQTPAQTETTDTTAAEPTETAPAEEIADQVVTENTQGTVGSKAGNVTMGPDSDKKTMVVCQSESFDTLDPFYTTGSAKARIRAMCFDTLWDLPLNALDEVGCCAKTWTIQDDNVTVSVEIYDNIHDSEGNPIDAYDFAWAQEKMLEAGTGTNVVSITPTGDYTMDVLFRSEITDGSLSACIAPAVNREAYEADPERFRNDPITSGQYKCISFTAGASATFMQTYNYWGDPSRLADFRQANVDVVRLDVVTEQAQKMNGLTAGDLQISGITVSIAEDLKAYDTITVTQYPTSTPNFILFNCYEGSVFSDNRALRECIAYALDYDSMCMAATRGRGVYNGTFGFTSLKGYDPAWQELAYQYNPELAKQKLEEAGYKPGELTLHFITEKEDETAVIMQACLADVGINFECNVLDKPAYKKMRDKADSLEWDLAFASTGHRGFMTKILTAVTNAQFSYGCYAGTYDDELHQLAQKARQTQDPADIDLAYRTLFDKLWYLPLWETYDYCGMYNKIESVVLNSNLTVMPNACNYADDYDVFYTP